MWLKRCWLTEITQASLLPNLYYWYQSIFLVPFQEEKINVHNCIPCGCICIWTTTKSAYSGLWQFPESLIWDPAVLLCYSRASGGETAQSLGRKPKTERGGVMPCFLFHYGEIPPKYIKCISTVASLHGVDINLICETSASLIAGVWKNNRFFDSSRFSQERFRLDADKLIIGILKIKLVHVLLSATENSPFCLPVLCQHACAPNTCASCLHPKFSGDKMAVSDKLIRPAPASLKAAIWQHFGFYEVDGKMDKTYAVCKVCRSQIKYFGNTTNLRNHISRYHSELGGKATRSWWQPEDNWAGSGTAATELG